MEFKVTRELQYVEFDHELSDDELCHHKYIKKERVNGKWRYYYNVGKSGFVINGQKDSPIKSYTKLEDIMGKDEKDRAWNADRAYEDAHDTYIKRRNDVSNSDRGRLERAKDRAGTNARKAFEEYYKTPLGKLTQLRSAIYRGKEKLADYLERKASDLRSNPKRYY